MGEGGGDVLGTHLALLLQLANQVAHKIEIAFGDAADHPLLEQVHSFGVDLVDAGQLQGFNGLARRLLDGLEHAPLPRRSKQDGLAGAPGAAGTANAMNVGLGVVGNVVVNDVRNPVNVQAAGSDVGGDQNVDLPGLQPVDCLLPQFLRHVAVQRRGGVPAGG